MNGYTPKTYLPNYTNDFRECSNEDGDLVGIDPGKMGTYVICLALLVDRPTGVRPTCIMVDPSSAHCRSRWHPNWALRFHTTTMMSLSYTIVYWYILHKYMYNIYICIHMYTYMYIPWYSPLCSPLYPHYLRISLAPKILPPPRKPPAMCSNSSPAPAAEPPAAAPRPRRTSLGVEIRGLGRDFWQIVAFLLWNVAQILIFWG